MRSNQLVLGALALAIGLAGCEGPTTYHPASISSDPGDRTGYWDTRIETNRFRVSFAGNSMTSRDTVERYLLFRAAELTLQQGYDWFEMADRATERKSNTYVDRPFGGGPYGYWGPYWSYRSPRFGWRTWDPFWGDPFWDQDLDIHTVDRYQANAEIVMGHGPKPSELRAFDARDVVANLRSSIEEPH
jgi:hypothetical protein